MLKKVLFAIILIVIISVLAIVIIKNYKGILFHSVPWLIASAFLIGFISGILRGIRYNIYAQRSNDLLYRHNIDSFLEHWGTAVGIVILIISGYFILVGYNRFFSINLHFLGLIITLGFGIYFSTHFFISKKYKYLMPNISDVINGTIKKYLFRVKWNDTGKYLSSQKTAFLVFSIMGIIISSTGAIKLAAYYYSVALQLTHIATQIHDISARLFVLVLIIHILIAVVVSSNRRLLASFFYNKQK